MKYRILLSLLLLGVLVFLALIQPIDIVEKNKQANYPLPELKPFRPLVIYLLNKVFETSYVNFEAFNLTAPSLLREATYRAGGLIDLDDDAKQTFYVSLQALCTSLENDAQLNPVGRFLIREQTLIWIVNRLKLVQLMKERSLAKIIKPIFVVGMPRSGTTFLHNLLSLDEENFRSAVHWQIMHPIPIVQSWFEKIKLIAIQSVNVFFFQFLAPNVASVHPVTVYNAEECMPILAVSMLTLQFHVVANVTGYNNYLLQTDQKEAFKWHKNTLGAMQLSKQYVGFNKMEHDGGSPKSWLLKAPWHMNHLDTILQTYPDAVFLFPHREPSSMLSSLSSLYARFWSVVSDHVDFKFVGQYQEWQWDVIMGRFLKVRKSNVLKNQIFDLSFKKLSSDPIGEAKKIYSFLNLELKQNTIEKMQKWLREDKALGKKHAAGIHEYKAEWFGLDETKIKTMQNFKDYIAMFRDYI